MSESNEGHVDHVFRIRLGGFYAVPRPPKTRSGMTARQYRAARRKYAVNLRWARDSNRRLSR